MPHSAPRPWWRQVDRVAGISLAVVGVIVLVVALLALRQPKGREASQVSDTTTTTVTQSDSGVPTDASGSSSGSSASASASTSPSSSASSSAATSSAPASPTGVKAVPLIVLNNTSKTGLAMVAAQRFEAGGWTVTSTANLVNNIISTCAYYDPATAGAQAAATALQAQFPAIKRVKPKFSGLPAGPVVVVLAADYS